MIELLCLGDNGTVVWDICLCENTQNCTHRERILSYVNKRKFNYDVEGTEDGRQTVRNDFNCISSEWHSHPKAARNERSSGLSNFEKQCFDWIM